MEGDVTVTSSNRKCSAVTGSARKLKDNAADWHNLMLTWNKLNEAGVMATGNIANMRLCQDDASPSGGAAELQHQCDKLQEIVDKMVVTVTKMERLVTSQQGVQELEQFQFGPGGRKYPLFHTWTSKHFESSSRCLLDSFRLELKLKRTILQELAHVATSDLCMVYLSCWLHLPYTPPHTRLTLEAQLLETGHRPL